MHTTFKLEVKNMHIGEEISNIMNEANSILKSKTYEEAFEWAKDTINQFPNCESLIWQIAVLFDGWRQIHDIPYMEKYDTYIEDCYVRSLNSKDEDIKRSAADSLFGLYVRKEQYEKAEECLMYYSKNDPERKRKQAVIFSKTNRVNEAYKTYEELLFSGYQMMSMVMNNIYILAMKEGNKEKAHMLIKKQKELAHLFEMGRYHEVSCGLELATLEKDVDATIEIMDQMLESIDKITEFSSSKLYEHMEFKEVSKDLLKDMKQNLILCFRDEETYNYMKNNSSWKTLVKL